MSAYTLVVVVLLGVAAPGFAAEREALQVYKDAAAEIRRYPLFTIYDSVQVQLGDGVVTLTGKVTQPFKRNAIARRVAAVEGVSRVVNRIEVLPVSRFDDALRLQVARAIYRNPTFATYGSMVNPPIHVIVERGRVTLEGVVRTEGDRLLAHSLAGFVTAFSITNALQTEAEARDALENVS